MALPFNRDSESAKRQPEVDPFLEFEPERPSLLDPSLSSPRPAQFQGPPSPLRPDPHSPSVVTHPAVSLQIRHRSGVGKVLARVLVVAIVVAGVAIAAVRGDRIRPALSSFTTWARTAVLPSSKVPGTPSSQTPGGADADPVTGVTVAPLAGPAPPDGPAAPSTSPSGTLRSRAANSSPPAGALARGVIVFRSPLDLQVFHQGRLIGTTGAHGVTLPVGVVDLVLVSAAHEFRQARSVRVTNGKPAAVTVSLPDGLLSVNAEPWAEVFIDSRSVGMTPLADIPVRIGSHEVVWRHPTLGERRQVVVVKARTPARAGVDFWR